ncbi:small integral membrane protein 24 isoform X2 [Passer montanus]|uniref:small integral membrane protein 24 isoform X2 n=1 Tax=Passer montanus TaxID=9160 RepID=UPI00196150EB|nr:small integral membrane protein 24 isoform X2 [Passer montanus]
MPKLLQPLSLLLVLASTAQGQTVTGPKVLQPWLIGLTAVVVFLFAVFVVLLVNRLWSLRKKRKEKDTPETLETDRYHSRVCGAAPGPPHIGARMPRGWPRSGCALGMVGDGRAAVPVPCPADRRSVPPAGWSAPATSTRQLRTGMS